ncbi:sulfonate ABC transporter substrate-binding protein [Undibacterium oligocarboniphilum]|uniref:Putative aliphatic sulfonates-binding protein n=1 Tax=Undibacterium oligocarboniphilum TaxID=666702 RepID=A0A850QAI8_9BURK|nr:sulfonate ABC transporter substrate-binding protein [Undibacterium oligocarboniphilum]MBC3871019.1 sulfonate ABC transporter substrate-binding protein [Undibacterium oligocarboniphilum]NVO76358.1 sulfonate ABC transporter substrate-binding protein [Undibacterium oligocarboniphilum]
MNEHPNTNLHRRQTRYAEQVKKNSELRRRLLTGLLTLVACVVAGGQNIAHAQNSAAKSVLRIGYQKYGTLTVLKGNASLEKRLAPLGVDVKWIEFPAGPQLLEGLNVGSIDFGTTGEAPPIFAQAAGADLLYVGNEPAAPAGEAIVVPKGSALKSVADLKGKKIVLNKGSNVHYLLVKLLEKAGLAYKDVEVVFLAPADARAAFERGSVDAWAIWDPFLAAAEKQLGARVLADGKGAVSNHQFYLASRLYAQKHPAIISLILEEIAKTGDWSAKNIRENAAILSVQIGLEPSIVELSVGRFSYGVKPLSEAVIHEQQSIADTFADLKLIPKRIHVRDAVWLPSGAKTAAVK